MEGKGKKIIRLWVVIVLYLGVVLLFALINWGMFEKNTTSFLISDQLNKHVDRFVFNYDITNLSSYRSNDLDNMPITISEYNQMAGPIYDELDSLNRQLTDHHQQLDSCSRRLDSLTDLASHQMSDSIAEFRTRMLSDIQDSIDSLKQYMADKDSTEMILEGKEVELSKLQYELAKKNVDVQNYIVNSYGSFMHDSLRSQIGELNDNYISQSSAISSLEISRIKVVQQIHDIGNAFHQKRTESVGFLDFLYYSFCVSTTVNFGDIAPNSSWTRLVAVGELLVCLVLVGIILAKIMKRLDDKHTDEEKS